MDKMKPTLKFITKRDFVELEHKYLIRDSYVINIIDNAKPLDVLILQVIPDIRLKVLNVKILNEENFLDCLKNGIFNDK